MNNSISRFGFGLGVWVATAMAGQAEAGLIASQAQLSTILGVNKTLEDFEGLNIPVGGQISDSSPLSSTSAFAGQGPGLVKAGATYSASRLFWNGQGYYGQPSKDLGDSAVGGPLTITYTSLVNAFGFDLPGYQGYAYIGTAAVYDLSNTLISTTAINGGFFGWQEAAGISKVVLTAASQSYVLIDNHGFGPTRSSGPTANSVPEPSSLATAFIGVVGGLIALSRHRKAIAR